GVPRPGGVPRPEGPRVAGALAAAGGALPGTDLMGLNLARRLSDGEQVPVGIAPPPGQLISDPVPGTTGVPPVVDLNSATLEQLDALPGVGMAMAQRVLDWRQAHGRFTSVDQLRQVSGFGQARLAKLRHGVRVGPGRGPGRAGRRTRSRPPRGGTTCAWCPPPPSAGRWC